MLAVFHIYVLFLPRLTNRSAISQKKKEPNIASGFRCPDYNKRIGGAEKSYHMRGQAADIKSSNVSIDELYALAKKYFGDGGIGRYKTFIHVDTGPKRRWNG